MHSNIALNYAKIRVKIHFHENWVNESNGEIALPIDENMDIFDMLVDDSSTYKVISTTKKCLTESFFNAKY